MTDKKPLLKGAWISSLPTTGEVAQRFRQEYCVGSLVNMPGFVWEQKDRDKAVRQVKWLADNYDIVFGQFGPATIEAIRLAYLKFCHDEPVLEQAWKSWPGFYSPVFKDGNGLLRFAAIA